MRRQIPANGDCQMTRPDDRFMDLASRYLDRQTDGQEVLELEQMLKDSPEARKLMGRLLNQHVALRSMSTNAMPGEFDAESSDQATTPDAHAFRSGTGTAFRRLVPLAAAASILIAAGLAYHFMQKPASVPPASNVYRVALKTGNVSVQNDLITTESNSVCRIEYPDGTLVAIGDTTSVKLSPDDPVSGKQIHLDRGRIYVDAPKIGKRLAVLSRNFQCDITGTKFMVGNREGTASLLVLEGEVMFSRNKSATYVSAGQGIGGSDAGDSSYLTVVSMESIPVTNYEWLDGIGVESKSLPNRFARPKPALTSLVDLNNYTFHGGTWRIVHTNSGYVVRQENTSADMESTILFGKPAWKSGVFSFKCRILGDASEIPDGDVAINVMLHTGQAAEGIGIRNRTRDLLQAALKKDPEGWIVFRVRFLIPNATELRCIAEIWPESDPSEKYSLPFHKNPGNSRFIKTRDVCGIGLSTTGCAVEFRDLKLENAVGADGTRNGEDAKVKCDLTPWVADYYKRLGQFVLAREKFTDGAILDTLTPAQLKELAGKADASSKVVRHTMRNGKEGDAFSIENAVELNKTKLRTAVELPEAFAVEFDLKPFEGESFKYEGYDVDVSYPHVDLTGTPALDERIAMPAMPLDRWSQFRVEYFRVGQIASGEYIYEMRLPHTTGSGIGFTWGTEAGVVGTLLYRGGRLLVGDVRIRQLLPPAALDRSSTKNDAAR
ncbi:MAG: hypothetical protein C0404_06870 [Verrucomicrobia bacterium]|nr:hypothetical protein [Verrucomicrobiota bacterium]